MLKVISQIISLATTREQIDQIRKFADDHNLGSSVTIKTALKNAQMNLEWADENIPIIKGILKHNY